MLKKKLFYVIFRLHLLAGNSRIHSPYLTLIFNKESIKRNLRKFNFEIASIWNVGVKNINTKCPGNQIVNRSKGKEIKNSKYFSLLSFSIYIHIISIK